MATIKVPRPRDRGAVTVLVAILFGLGVLMPVTALVIDVGSIYVESEELQTGADAAAMAVAKACSAGQCAVPADIVTQRAVARTSAGANAKDGHTSVTELCGNWGSLPACSTQSTKLSACVGAKPSGNYVEVRVATENADGGTLLPPKFARTIVGNDDYPGTQVASCSRVAVSDVCVTAAKATYKHTFNGPAGTATITADQPLCAGEKQVITLVSYTAPSASFGVPQFMYDYDTKEMTSEAKSLTFNVDVPACFTQVDFVFTTAINPLTSAAYGDRKIGSSGAPGNRSVGPQGWYNGGTKTCSPQPAVTFTAQCDGTMLVKLSNGSGANVDAAFTVTAGGDTAFYRVVKAQSKTVKILASAASNVTVADNTFDTSTAKWVKPKKC
jgi:hypothetical protein